MEYMADLQYNYGLFFSGCDSSYTAHRQFLGVQILHDVLREPGSMYLLDEELQGNATHRSNTATFESFDVAGMILQDQ